MASPPASSGADDDTVCKFCGVSYLIYSEMRALESKLSSANAEVAKLRGSLAAMPRLESALSALQSRVESDRAASRSNVSGLESRVGGLTSALASSQRSCSLWHMLKNMTLRRRTSSQQQSWTRT